MNEALVIRAALDASWIDAGVKRTQGLSGGCIHQVMRIELDDGRSVVAKINDARQVGIFEEEAAGVRALRATQTVRTPEVLGVGAYAGGAVLLLSELKAGRSDDGGWARFGADLAQLHAADVAGGQYGWAMDNHLGSTFQPNTPSDEWVAFNARCRLGWQLELGRKQGVIEPAEGKRIEALIDRLGEFIPSRPKPALLHGDLWSGNALPTVDEDGAARIAVIDPACYVGDGWADIAMMKLFGGFGQSCFRAYGEAVEDHENIEQRIAVYQLYHLLNHVNIFGRGYVGQAMGVLGRLGL